MKKFIHHIRKKPEHVRKNILHALTLFFAVILVTLWVYSLGANFANTDTQAKVEEGFKPFTVLKDSALSLW